MAGTALTATRQKGHIMSKPTLDQPQREAKPGEVPTRDIRAAEAFEAFCAANQRAQRSMRIEDGIRAGRAWGTFLRHFEKRTPAVRVVPFPRK